MEDPYGHTSSILLAKIWKPPDVSESNSISNDRQKELDLVVRLRKVVSDMSVVEAMELLRTRLLKTKSNAEFLMTMNLA